MARWDPDSLERALRKALRERASLKVLALPPPLAADVTWTDAGKAHLRIDDHDVGLRPGVLHELMHVVLEEELRAFADPLAEEFVLALERLMDQRISSSRRRLAWWRKEIEALRR